MYFRKDGTFTDRYFAPCGIDVNIHQYNGKWKFEGDEIKIFDLKEKYNKANIYPTKKGFKMLVKSTGKFRVLSSSNEGLVLEIINEYDNYYIIRRLFLTLEIYNRDFTVDQNFDLRWTNELQAILEPSEDEHGAQIFTEEKVLHDYLEIRRYLDHVI